MREGIDAMPSLFCKGSELLIKTILISAVLVAGCSARPGQAPPDAPGPPSTSAPASGRLVFELADVPAGGPRLEAVVSRAEVVESEVGGPAGVQVELDAAGAAAFAELTARIAGQRLAVKIGDRVLMVARVMEPIPGGRLRIDPGAAQGGLTAEQLVAMLRGR